MRAKHEETVQTGSYALIPLGHGINTIVDMEVFNRLGRYHWRLKRSGNCMYAVRRQKRDRKTYEIKLHREVTNCPQGYVVHHVNHDSLDNRKINLKILTAEQHDQLNIKWKN